MAGKLKSGASAKAISALFPSRTKQNFPPKRAFDPLEDCVFSHEQQKRKKATTRIKAVQVSVFVVKADTKCIPRGAWRRKLIEQKHLVRVNLSRNLSESDMREAIVRETGHLNVSEKFTILECVGHRLVAATNQHRNGNDIIDDAQKRKGSVLYICPNEVRFTIYNFYFSDMYYKTGWTFVWQQQYSGLQRSKQSQTG